MMVKKTEESTPSQEETGNEEETAAIAVVVLKGKTVKYNGATYEATNRLEVSESDAVRLEKLGFVARQDALVAVAAEKSESAVKITVSDGVKITQG
ncbi:hypothetical protein ABRZ24_13770 [Brenneria populi]|uniref:Uncharacterized protein n=1 Tax=Brenneria populi TaxID=1505588 RepID=A0ABU6JSZ8_9GAMM|nr:hypothetical protein [Brenneria populi Li et al. 2015]